MKALISIFCLLLITVVGCKSSRKVATTTFHSQRDSVSVVDSSTEQLKQVSDQVSDTNKVTIIRDSLINLPGRSVIDSVNKEDLEIARTKNGVAVTRRFDKRENGVRAWAIIDTNGNLTYGCEVDSYKLVVKNLIRQTEVMSNIITKLEERNRSDLKQSNVYSDTTNIQETVKVIKKSWWGRNWWWIILLVIVAAALFILYKIWRP